MTRPVIVALKLVVPLVGVAALALTLRGVPAMDEEVALKRARAGRTPVAQGADERRTLEGRQGEILASELEPPADPARRPADRGGAQAPAALPLDRRQNVMAVRGGAQHRPQPGEQRAARATWWWPFGGGGAVATPPPGGAVSPSSPAPQPAPRGGGASGPAAMLEFLAIGRDGATTLPGESFSVGRARDLRILVWWNVAGSHTQRLELLSPDGALYQRIVGAFDADAARFEGRSRSDFVPVETLLPVAGTWITDNSLFGDWTVNVYLDGERTPITSATFFVSS